MGSRTGLGLSGSQLLWTLFPLPPGVTVTLEVPSAGARPPDPGSLRWQTARDRAWPQGKLVSL